MSELIILGYEDHDSATRAYERVLELQRDFVVDLSGLAVVKVSDDGKQHVDTPGRIVGASAASGALWGMLFGLLFLVPVFGFAMGGLMGAVSGRLSKSGIDRAFRDRVQAMLEPGKAAVVVMARKITEDTRPTMEPKLKALEQTLQKRFAAAVPAPASGGSAPAKAPAPKK